MVITLNIPPELEQPLREASEHDGVVPEQWITDAIQKKLPASNGAALNDDAARVRSDELRKSLLARIARVDSIPAKPIPPLKGQEAEFERGVIEKLRKQGVTRGPTNDAD
jgi:hypothetical protein